jgi:4-hydroxy-2-oxoglutarate aldolase
VMGYDAVLVRQPIFQGVGSTEQRLYFQAVADGAALPVILSGQLSVDLLAVLAAHPQVLGCVGEFPEPEAIKHLLERTAGVRRTVTVTQVFAAVTGRMQAAQRAEGDGLLSVKSLSGGGVAAAAPAKSVSPVAFKSRTKVVGFQVLAGRTERMLGGLTAGAVGAMPLLAASAPQACYEVMAAWKDGDPGLSAEKQIRLTEAIRLVEDRFGVPGLKYGCDLNGYFGGVPRIPILPVTGQQRVEIEEAMSGLKS